ncbi:MAG: Dna2/Cas4 domain-containing protein [Ktedonobacteraceae bacterium]|nr:Dna2/Cas4 domain-containing protein [Ktedonobacteraceae bacterium]
MQDKLFYSIPLKRAEAVPITPMLRQKVVATVKEIKRIIESEMMPPPLASRMHCVTCEFRRFCNDVVWMPNHNQGCSSVE